MATKITVEVERLNNGRWVGRVVGGISRGVEIRTNDIEEVFQTIRDAVARVTGAPPPAQLEPTPAFIDPSPRFARHGPRSDENAPAPVQPATEPLPQPP